MRACVCVRARVRVSVCAVILDLDVCAHTNVVARPPPAAPPARLAWHDGPGLRSALSPFIMLRICSTPSIRVWRFVFHCILR